MHLRRRAHGVQLGLREPAYGHEELRQLRASLRHRADLRLGWLPLQPREHLLLRRVRRHAQRSGQLWAVRADLLSLSFLILTFLALLAVAFLIVVMVVTSSTESLVSRGGPFRAPHALRQSSAGSQKTSGTLNAAMEGARP